MSNDGEQDEQDGEKDDGRKFVDKTGAEEFDHEEFADGGSGRNNNNGGALVGLTKRKELASSQYLNVDDII